MSEEQATPPSRRRRPPTRRVAPPADMSAQGAGNAEPDGPVASESPLLVEAAAPADRLQNEPADTAVEASVGHWEGRGSENVLAEGTAALGGRSRGRRGRGRGRRATGAVEETAETAEKVASEPPPQPPESAVAGEPSAPPRAPRSRGGRSRTVTTASRSEARSGRPQENLDQGPTEAIGLSTPEPLEALPLNATGDAAPDPWAAAGADDMSAAEEAEVEQLGKTPAPRARGRSKAVSPITVNIGVPRGLGRRVNSKLIDRVVRAAMAREGWQTPAVLEVHIVDDEEMREVNATRRGIDEPTDVLSFPLVESKPGQGVTEDFFVLPPDEVQHLGEILISFPRAETQADEAGHSRERELAFLTAHGVLHILGYDHENDEERRQMRRREEEVLGELGLSRNGS